MANKKVSQLTTKSSVNTTDLLPIADPTTGQLYKATLSSLGAVIGSAVASVNGLVGVVVLDTDDIQELSSPTNKWYTDTRARAALSASSPLTYNSGTGAFGIQVANGSQGGYLTSTDWTAFNNTVTGLALKLNITDAVSTYQRIDKMVSNLLASDTEYPNSNAVLAKLALKADTTNPVFDGYMTIGGAYPKIYLTDSDNNPDYFIGNDDGYFRIYDQTNTTSRFYITSAGASIFPGSVTVGSIAKDGGTSAQFLKADGSVDSSTYATTSSLSSYITTSTAASTYQRIDKMVSNLLASDTEYPNSNAVLAKLALKADAADPVFTGNMTISGAAPKLYFVDTDQNPDYTLFADAGYFYIYDQTAGTSRFYITPSGVATVPGSMVVGSIAKSGGLSTEYLMADGSVSTGGGGSMTYPGAGIALSTGTAWGTSITNNSGNWNTAYSWGNHAGLYLPLSGGTLTGTLKLGNFDNEALKFQTATSTGASYLRFYNSAGTARGYFGLFNASGTDYLLLDGSSTNVTINGNSNLNLQTGGSNRITITSAGNVGIGTTSPTKPLYINSTVSDKLYLTGGTAQNGILLDAVGTSHQYYYGAGNNLLVGGDQGALLAYDVSTGRAAVFFDTSNNIRFGTTASGEWMRVNTSGNFLIGTTTDSGYPFIVGKPRDSGWQAAFVNGATPGTVQIFLAHGDGYGAYIDTGSAGNSTERYIFKLVSGGGEKFVVRGDGLATFSSSVNATGFFESSDKNLKTLIEDNYQAKGIETITPKLYTKNGLTELGYYAQDVQTILPSAVTTGADGFLNLSYREVHTAKIARLEKRVEELEAQLNII